MLLVRLPAVFGGTSQKGDTCYFPFAYNGSLHYSCIPDDKSAPWCFTTADSKRWGYCSLPPAQVVFPTVTMWGGSSRINDTCSFPFPFNGLLHAACIAAPSLDPRLLRPWCLTLDNGRWARWGYCLNTSALEVVPVWGGSSIKGDVCSFPFPYHTALQAACITAGKGRPWCFSAANLSRWGYCGHPPPPKVSLMGEVGNVFSNMPTTGAHVRAFPIASVYASASLNIPANTSVVGVALTNASGIFTIWLEPGHYHLHFSTPTAPAADDAVDSTLAALAPSVFTVTCQFVQHCMFSREGALALTCSDEVHSCGGACKVKVVDKLNVAVREQSVTCYPLSSVDT